MSEEITVGAIRALLKMDDSPWRATIDAAKEKAAELSKTDPKIKIRVDDGAALQKLAAVRTATLSLESANERVARAEKRLGELNTKGETSSRKLSSAQRELAAAYRQAEQAGIRLSVATQSVEQKATEAHHKIGALTTAILAVGPALVPLAAVGVGAIAGLGATAGAAIVAFKGIQAEMKAGTATGQQYTVGMNTLKSEFSQLETIAAHGVLGGFQTAIAGLQPLFPSLNRDMGVFSTQLGQIVGHAVPGLVALFHQLEPLFNDIGQALVGGATKFEAWAKSSDAIHKFVAYVQAELPQVEHTLAELFTLVGHLTQAFAPLGGSTLTTIGLLAHALNAIPIGVLKVLVPLVTSSVLAIKGFQVADAAAGSISKLTTALRGYSLAQIGAIGGIGAFVVAAGAAGMAIGKWVDADKAFNYVGQNAKQVTDDFTQALMASKGAVDGSILAMAALKLEQSGLAERAAKAGISISELATAITGTDQQFISLGNHWKAAGDPSGKTLSALVGLRAEFNTGAAAASAYNGELDNIPAASDAATAALNNQKAAVDLLATAQANLNLVQSQNSFEQSLISVQQRHAQAVASLTAAQAANANAATALASAQDAVTRASLQDAAAQRQLTAANQAEKRAIEAIAADKAKIVTDTAKAVAAKQAEVKAQEALRIAQATGNISVTKLAAAQSAATKAHNAATAAASRVAVDQKSLQTAEVSLASAKDRVANAQDAVTRAALAGQEAQRQLAQAQQSAASAADALKRAQDEASTALQGTSAAAVRNRGDILSMASAAIQAAEQIGQKFGQVAESKALTTMRQQIIDAGLAAGESKGQIEAFLDSFLVIPVLTPTAYDRYLNQQRAAQKNTNFVNRAAGGFVSGPGSSTSDSVQAHLSNGEYVIQAAAVSKFGRGFLDSINAGIAPSVASSTITNNRGVQGNVTVEQHFHNPAPEPASKSSADGLRSAGYQLGGL